jgi:hypothetical protein
MKVSICWMPLAYLATARPEAAGVTDWDGDPPVLGIRVRILRSGCAQSPQK